VSTDILVLAECLCDVTEAQVESAKQLKGEELQELNQRRSDLLFELHVALQGDQEYPDEVREQLTEHAVRLKEAETLLTRIAGIVASSLEGVAPTTNPQTYGRRGRLTY